MTEGISVDGNRHNLAVGQSYNDYEHLSTAINAFCKEHYHRFVIRTRSKKQVLYRCCHGIKQVSKCQGKRPNQHYYFKSCPAQINFYKGKKEKWTLTKLVLDHNHTIGKEEYESYGNVKKMRGKKYSGDKTLNFGPSSIDAGIIVDVIKMETSTDDDSNFPNKELSHEEKLNTALTITKNIAYTLSNYDTPTFNKYIEELKIIESNAINGISLIDNEINQLCAIKVEEPVIQM